MSTRIDDVLAIGASSGEATVTFPTERMDLRNLDRRADDWAAMIAGLGVAPSERVAVWLPPSLELIAAIFGVSRAGCVGVPVSDRFRASELRHVLCLAEPQLLITTAGDAHVDRIDTLRKALPDLGADLSAEISSVGAPALRRVITARPRVLGGSARLSRRQSVDELAILMSTSGTSSAPKACMLTHESLVAAATSLARERYLLTEDSVVWSPLPLFHIAGMVSMMATFSAGASFVHSGVFQVETTLPLLESERVTHALAAFETIWMRLIDSAERDAVDLSSITFGLSANGEQQLQALHERLPDVAFVGNYGSTEASGHLAMGRPDEREEVRLAGGGLPLPGAEVRITHRESGEELPAGNVGQIEFRGVYRFAGYYRDAAANAESLLPDGWFQTGDLGAIDEDGRLYFRGRLKDMLKVGGENVAAPEVEAFLRTHPAVNVVAVVGAPDEHYGEVPAAFVELAPQSQLTEQELIEFCLGEIATFKVPRYVRFVSEWPMSGTKIKKDELAGQLAAELREAGITVAPRLRDRSRGAAS